MAFFFFYIHAFSYFCSMAKYTLRKYEILSGFRQISELFRSDKSVYCYPLKLYFKVSRSDVAIKSKVLFSATAPKRNFSKAVDRNLLKRRIRESYRQNKFILVDHLNEDLQLMIMFVYIGRKVENYEMIDKAVIKILSELKHNVIKWFL